MGIYGHSSCSYDANVVQKIGIMKPGIVCFGWACLMALAFSGCSNSSGNNVVVVDGDHKILLHGGNGAQLPYEIRASSAIQLDISHYQFMAEDGSSVKPDTVKLYDTAKRVYRLYPISGALMTLDAGTLNTVQGPAFEGFKPGHHLVLHVGRDNSGKPGAADMIDDWVALIIVK
jgi:hypothetical protein